MALQMRPFLTAYEMAGGARADADRASAEAVTARAQASDAQGKSFDNMRARAEQRQKQEEIELVSEATRSTFEPVAPSAPAAATPPFVPVQNQVVAPTPATIAPVQAQVVEPVATPVRDAQVAATPLPAYGQMVADGPQGVAEQVDPAPAAAPAAPATPVAVQAAAPIAEEALNASEPSQPAQPQATAVPVPVAQQLRSTPTINGKPNMLSDDVAERRIQVINQLVADKKIRSTTADEMVAGIQAGRAAQLKAATELQEKIANIADKNISTKAKAIEVRAAMRAAEDDLKYEVFKVYKSGDVARAQQLAREYGFGDADLSNPSTVADFGRASARAPQYYKEQKELREQTQEARLGRDADALKPVPGVPGTFYNRDGRVTDSAGKPLTTTQIQQMDNASKKAGATSVNVGTGESKDLSGTALPPGAIPLPKVDAKDILVARDNANAARGVIDDATRMGQLYQEMIKKSGYDPTDSKFGASFKAWYAKNIENDPLAREYDVRLQRMINGNLRLNKGSQTDNDAQREGTALTKRDMNPAAHDALLNDIINRSQRQFSDSQSIQRGYIMPNEDAGGVAAPKKIETKVPVKTVQMISPKGVVVEVPAGEVAEAADVGFKKVGK